MLFRNLPTLDAILVLGHMQLVFFLFCLFSPVLRQRYLQLDTCCALLAGLQGGRKGGRAGSGGANVLTC